MSRKVDVAEAIKTALDAHTFVSSVPLTIERRWLPYMERSEMGTNGRISVVPNAEEVEPATRGKNRHLIVVDVFVQRAVDWKDLTAVDEVDDLSEETFGVVRAVGAVQSGEVAQIVPNFEPAIVAEHLIENRFYTSRATSRWIYHG